MKHSISKQLTGYLSPDPIARLDYAHARLLKVCKFTPEIREFVQAWIAVELDGRMKKLRKKK